MEILVAAAREGSVTPAQAGKFLRGFGQKVRLDVAAREDLPLVMLVALAGDKSAEVRGVIAAHPSTPPEVLKAMMRVERRGRVVALAAGNMNTPSETLRDMWRKREVWAADDSDVMRKDSEGWAADALLGNPNLPVECVVEGLRSGKWRTVIAALENGNAPASELEAYWVGVHRRGWRGSAAFRSGVVAAVVGNESCPGHIVWEAASGRDTVALLALWKNRSLSERAAARAWRSCFTMLYSGPPLGVFYDMVDNPGVPRWIIADALEKGLVPWHIRQGFVDRLA
jgi:hypothetical protein